MYQPYRDRSDLRAIHQPDKSQSLVWMGHRMMNAPSRALTPTLYDMPWQAFLKIIPLLFLSIPLLPFLGRRIRNHFLNKETITFDLPVLGKSRQQGEKIRGTAVVCGGR